MRSWLSFDRSNAAQQRLHELIPGGAHTYARGPDQYPEYMAPVLVRGSGCHVWDFDDNEFIEYGMGLRSVTLGHGFRPVVDAVSSAIADGVNFSRPTVLELRAAEEFLSLVPTAEMVKFAKNGSDVTTAAVRLARAVTGKERIAVCWQPFFSTDDWFMSATPMNRGIPERNCRQIVRFRYNDLTSLAAILAAGDIACVLLEAATATGEPAPGYLQGVRSLCDRHGALLIIDEITTGFRWSGCGAQGLYQVVPDLSCWGKGIANGFPLSALAGKREFMELGGLRTRGERVFLLSTTFGPETGSLAAFRAVVEVYRKEDPIGRMEHAGNLLVAGVRDLLQEHGLSDYLEIVGRPSCLMFVTRGPDGRTSQEYRTLFLQELLRHGVLGQSFVTSAAHTEDDIVQTLEAVDAALGPYGRAIEQASVAGFLQGRPVAPAIRSHAWPRKVTAARQR